ncbi:MAG: hypothetical protein CMJ78_19610 [Planctomycetaceae bacterium]|nr:hypothetical protein [Planctomycetaceae bacterium]
MARTPPEVTKINDVTIIVFGSDYENLDEQCLDDVRDLILNTAEEADPPRMLLDLSNTSFFGSSFIEVLFRVWNRMNGKDGKFAITGLTPYCKEVLEITHLDRIWGIYDSQDEAFAAFDS